MYTYMMELVVVLLLFLLYLMNNSLLTLIMLLELYNLVMIKFYLNSKSYEEMLIYLMVNSMGTLLLFVFLLNIIMYNKYNFLIIMTLMIKLGFYPTHWFMLSMYKHLNYYYLLLVSMMPKLFIILLLYYFSYLFNMYYYYIMINISLFTTILLSLNYNIKLNIKVLLGMSSITNIMYMLFINNIKYNLMFLVLYVINMLSLFMMLLFVDYKDNMHIIKLLLYISIFSFMGMPPLLGFYMKMLVLTVLNNFTYILYVLFISLIMSVVYISLIKLMYFNQFIKDVKHNYLLLTNFNSKIIKHFIMYIYLFIMMPVFL